jgi:hypothetical protein
MYNNDNKLPDSYITQLSYVTFGRNGFYPVIYSDTNYPNNTQMLTAVILGDP